jgi:hypothetical protein
MRLSETAEIAFGKLVYSKLYVILPRLLIIIPADLIT